MNDRELIRELANAARCVQDGHKSLSSAYVCDLAAARLTALAEENEKLKAQVERAAREAYHEGTVDARQGTYMDPYGEGR